MRVMIEFDLPDGQAVPTVDDIKRLTDPNWISDWWHIDDVGEVCDGEDLTDDERREVLRRAKKNRDASIGLNWETFEYLVDAVKNEREAA
jgi:hypothetical protein